jgi:hypothetical protein
MSFPARICARWMALALLPACTLDEGHGFASLRSAELAIAFEPGARAYEGYVLTDLGHRILVDSFTVEIDRVELQKLTSTGEAGAFDPAEPPPGYTLCHGGHCHAEDGRLVDYAHVEAELASGEVRHVPVVTLPVNRTASLSRRVELVLDDVEPSRELPQVSLGRAVLVFSRVELTGVVEPASENAAAAPLSLRLDEAFTFHGDLVLVVSRDGPDTLRLGASLDIDGTLFDGVNWDLWAREGALPIEEPESALGRTLVSNLLENELDMSIQ